MEISPLIKEKAPIILAEIEKAKSILLHCHPSPDPDSVCSVLAIKFVLEGMGKKVTAIRGDSVIPSGFAHFPGVGTILPKNFTEIDLKEFDLFISLDSGSPNQISRIATPVFPLQIKSIVIDHHNTNQGYGDMNLIEPIYPATCQVLFDLFSVWNIQITTEIAQNLFIGIYTDTGGFKFQGTTAHTFAIASKLIVLAPNFTQLISEMENSDSPSFVAFKGLALNSVQMFCDGKVGLSIVSADDFKKKGIPTDEISAGVISGSLRSVKDWVIVGAILESEPGKIKCSFRSKNADPYDVSKLAVALGGGGHKNAAGAGFGMNIDDAQNLVVSKIKELYNL